MANCNSVSDKSNTEAPTMKNATSLSSVYSGDNITEKEVKTAIIFSTMYMYYDTWLADIHVNDNFISEGCTLP